ncbi:MAG: hypothetical protein ACHQ6T_05565 [Myxococcota bacterium]
MSTRPVFWIAALGLTIATLGCEKIHGNVGSPTLSIKPLAARDGIPAEYGDLVGVIPGDSPGWALLFFQRADKSIVAVAVDGNRGILSDRALEIPRR